MSIEDQISREAAEQIDLALGRVDGRENLIQENTRIILAAIKREVAIEREIVKQDDRNSDK